MLDRILGVLAFVIFAAYLGVIMGFVPDLELLAVLLIVIAMAGYDFYLALFKGRKG